MQHKIVRMKTHLLSQQRTALSPVMYAPPHDREAPQFAPRFNRRRQLPSHGNHALNYFNQPLNVRYRVLNDFNQPLNESHWLLNHFTRRINVRPRVLNDFGQLLNDCCRISNDFNQALNKHHQVSSHPLKVNYDGSVVTTPARQLQDDLVVVCPPGAYSYMKPVIYRQPTTGLYMTTKSDKTKLINRVMQKIISSITARNIRQDEGKNRAMKRKSLSYQYSSFKYINMNPLVLILKSFLP